nr:hypothetical protein [uncultured Cohaesibacter sp.]
MAPQAQGRLLLSLMDGVQLRWLRDIANVDLIAEWKAASSFLF